MSKDERIEALETKCAELERRLSAFETHVIKLLADAARAKAPPKPEIPWESGKAILDEYAKKTQVYGPATISDQTQSKWPKPKPAPIFLKFEHPRRGVPS